MPQLEPIHDEGLTVALWRITEPEHLLADFTPSGIKLPSNAQRREERLATIALLKSQGLPVTYRYDNSGRPYFPDFNISFSVSHTDGMVAVAYASEAFCGVDVERISRNFEKVSTKFLTTRETCHASSYSQEHLALIWSAKEAIYKLPWKKSPVFSRDIEVLIEVEHLQRGWLFSRLREGENWIDLVVKYRFFEDFCLTWVALNK